MLTFHNGANSIDLSLLGGSEWHTRLAVDSTTQISINRYGGRFIPVKDSTGWRLFSIPSAGVTAGTTSVFIDGSSGNLASSTLYYVYLFSNSGTLTVDYSTTAYATDADTGLRIKTGVATRTLVGLVRTDGSTHFIDSVTQRFALNWYNRRPLAMANAYTANRTTTSATYVELNSEIRCEFLVWTGDSVEFIYSGSASQSAANTALAEASIGYNGTTADEAYWGSINASTNVQGVTCGSTKSGLTEGYNYATALARNGGGLTFLHTGSGTAGARNALVGWVRG